MSKLLLRSSDNSVASSWYLYLCKTGKGSFFDYLPFCQRRFVSEARRLRRKQNRAKRAQREKVEYDFKTFEAAKREAAMLDPREGVLTKNKENPDSGVTTYEISNKQSIDESCIRSDNIAGLGMAHTLPDVVREGSVELFPEEADTQKTESTGTTKIVQEFNENGFVVVDNLISEDTASKLARALDDVLQGKFDTGEFALVCCV